MGTKFENVDIFENVGTILKCRLLAPAAKC